MSKIRLTLSLIVLIFLIPSYSFSQIQETKEYKILKGDTLWDISKKELSDSFLWPKIWKENPAITNPDRVYPGQIIIIPLYLLQPEKKEVEEAAPAPEVPPAPPKEMAKEVTPPPAPEARPLVDTSLVIAGGYIAPSVEGIGAVTGSPSGRSLFGSNDMIFVKTDRPAYVGETFYIIRSGGPVYHPVTNKKIGYIVHILGVAEITRLKYGETEAKITECYNDILDGDLLDDYYVINPPIVDEPFRTPDIDGVVVAGGSARTMNSNFDVVFLDKGSDDGIEVGDMFRTIKTAGGHRIPNGTIQVINENDATATAVVRKASSPIMSGNSFTLLD